MASEATTRTDTRIAYGAFCTWWDSIYNVSTTSNDGNGLPCCPNCGGMLFELADEARFFKGADEYEQNGHTGYRKVVEWMRGKCFPSIDAATAAFNAEQNPPKSDG